MFTLLQRKEFAHEDSIWCCGWGRVVHKKEELNGEGDNSRDSMETEEVEEFIVTGSMDNTLKLWNINNDHNLEKKYQMEGHCFGVVSLDVNSDSTMIVSSSLDSTIRLWNVEDGTLMKKIEAGPLDVWTVAFSPDSKHVISGCHSGKINIYGVESGNAESTLDSRGKFILSIAYSPNGKYIASGAVDGIINVFDVATSKLVHTLEGHAMPIRSLCFSPDSDLLLTASDDKHMKLYDVYFLHTDSYEILEITGAKLGFLSFYLDYRRNVYVKRKYGHQANVVATLSGHASWVHSVAFSPDNTHFVSGSSDNTVKVWELDTRSCLHTFREHTDQVWQVKYNPDSNKILSVSDDQSINVYSHAVSRDNRDDDEYIL